MNDRRILIAALFSFLSITMIIAAIGEVWMQTIRYQDFNDCVAIIGKVYEATANRELPTAPVGTLSWATSTNTH